MGTRGLLGYIIRGVRRGCINFYDSGFGYLGPQIVKFLMMLTEEEKTRFKANLDKITWVGEKDPVPEYLQRRYAHLVEIDEWEKGRREKEYEEFLKWGETSPGSTWTSIFRSIPGPAILPLILEGKLEHIMDQTYFAEWDCSYAYWIDMDKEVLEIETGGQEIEIPFLDLKEGILSGDLQPFGAENYDDEEGY